MNRTIYTLVMAMVALPVIASAEWRSLAPGLELGRFRTEAAAEAGDSAIVILRADPEAWELKVLCISETGDRTGKTAREWCRSRNLTAATNAGMFATDRTTHVGYLANDGHVNSRGVNKYKSAAGYGRKSPGKPMFRIFDLDVTPLDEVRDQYIRIAQNLRLIKRPGKNRWSAQSRRWSEAALGEDSSGRILFIFSRTAYSMDHFNRMLLEFPIDLVAAQHLEGGPEAQLYISAGEQSLELVGGYESGLWESRQSSRARPIPNVFGLAPRE